MLFTIGHSNRSWEEFLALLRQHRVTLLVDVRQFPASRAHPHFSKDSMEPALSREGIAYRHMPALGGRRKESKRSRHIAFRVEGFRNYADYTESGEFKDALAQLIGLATGQHAAIMCAEAVPWRCHRRIIADNLVVRGIPVLDIISAGTAKEHTLPPFARVDGEQVIYDAGQTKL